MNSLLYFEFYLFSHCVMKVDLIQLFSLTMYVCSLNVSKFSLDCDDKIKIEFSLRKNL